MLNFTVGPVQSSDNIRSIGSEQVPYFRTPEFSNIMFENEELIKKFSIAQEGSRVVFITGSGTASMEAVVMNCFTGQDKLLIINGGSFGQRFVDLCKIHDVPFTEIRVETGKVLKEEMLNTFDNQGYTGLLINIHETSTGVLYDTKMISRFCKSNDIFLVVDAISSFLADPINMTELKIDIMITGSQKALACPPGVSIITMSPKAVDLINNTNVKSMYFNLKDALKNGERGQTPYTPAVGILRQINLRLKEIDANGGVESEISRISELASDFRRKIIGMPFDIVSDSMSNAVTPLQPLKVSAIKIFETLKDDYNIWVTPNGGDLKDKVFRVGHIGSLTKSDNTTLVNAMKDMRARGLL